MKTQPKDGGYPGGKGLDGLYQWIIGKMPTHGVYVEPFGGKGAILRRKPPALVSVVLDLDPDVIAWWHRLKWPAVTAEKADAIRWLGEHGVDLDADTLVYCDPPYMGSTRSKKRIYRFEMSDKDHSALLATVKVLQCRVMLSGYPSKLYESRLKGWVFSTREVITRGRTMRTEGLWCNFDPPRESPALALDYSSLGGDFRARERIARKVKRWVSRLLTIPADERRALVLAVLDAYRRSSNVRRDDADVKLLNLLRRGSCDSSMPRAAGMVTDRPGGAEGKQYFGRTLF